MKAILLMSSCVCLPLLQAAESPASHQTKAVVQVGGQVRKPGPIEIRNGMTAVEVIAAAGGATEFGSMKQVIVTREGKATRHNFSDEVEKDFKVKEGDTLEVVEKNVCGDRG